MNKTQQALLHLSLIKGVGPAVVAKLSTLLKPDTAAELYSFSVFDFVRQFSLTLKQAELLYTGLRQKKELDDELALIEKHRITVFCLFDEDYPVMLQQIHLPPAVLYCQGLLQKDEQCLAIVGSRKAHGYAQNFIESIVPSLLEFNWTIVSGGAIGADTMAHRATLAHKGKTIVVTGSGLLCPYPAQNRALFQSVVDEGGAVVSPFPLTMEALPGNFPARNRIIAGLSRGTIVAQAAEKSGASITAYFALEQGREVFALPGLVTDPLSAGCHRLIQQGAKLVTQANDILVEFGQTSKNEPKAQKEDEVNDCLLGNVSLTLPQRILQVCAKPSSIDELVNKTNESLDQLQSILFDLQIQNKISQDFAGLWVAK